MLYLGLDIHSKWMMVRGFNPETGESIEIKKISNDVGSIDEAFTELIGPLYGAIESGTNSWAVYRMLEPYFEKLIVVDPATVWGRDARRGAKTDRRDADKLAMKLYRGELEPLYIPDPATQDLRALTRGKINASRHVTKTVNEIGSLLRSWGITLECSLLSKKGQKILDESRLKLPEHSLKVLEKWIEMLRVAQETEDELEKIIAAEAAKDETCQILMTIPAVGALTALVIRSEVGDIHRFRSVDSFMCYCGLSPKVFQSADSIHYGKLNKDCNRYLKYVLVLCAQGMARSKTDNPLRQTYWRIALKGKNHAKIAVSRQLARVVFRMMRNGQCWDPSRIADRRKMSATLAA